MIVGGMYEGRDEVPTTTMFAQAGSGTPYLKKFQQSSVAQLMTEATTAFTTALSPAKTACTSPYSISGPAARVDPSYTNSYLIFRI